jgi:hypothetical protein
MLEETINNLRQGKTDLRVSNAIGFLSGILLKALEKGPLERAAQPPGSSIGRKGCIANL